LEKITKCTRAPSIFCIAASTSPRPDAKPIECSTRSVCHRQQPPTLPRLVLRSPQHQCCHASSRILGVLRDGRQ
jgi:hypothetical protein